MRAIKYIFFLLTAATLVAAGKDNTKPACTSKEACVKDLSCSCWCSVKRGWRNKTKEDHAFYVENDPNGKFCYCKRWDYDNYEANCINGENLQEPPGAE